MRICLHAGPRPQEVGPLNHAFHKTFVIAWRAVSRCSDRCFIPLRCKGQYELLVRCIASVQQPVPLLSTVPAFGTLRVPTMPSAPSADSSHGIRAAYAALSQFPWHATSRGTGEPSRGKLSYRPCLDAGFRKPRPLWMEGFAVACPLAPTVPHLLSGSCASPRTFVSRFLQTPPREDARALPLSFGSTYPWTGDVHPPSMTACTAHTPGVSRRWKRSAAHPGSA
jgi:hypothetical protein